MKRTRSVWFVAGLTCASASAVLAACASNENEDSSPRPAAGPTPDAAVDALSDGGLDAAACTDCVYFPAECAPDTLCKNGPFDPTNPTAGMDWRVQINVIVGRSATDIWAAGALGSIAHFDGASWTRSDLGVRETQRALWLRGDGELSFGSVSALYSRGTEGGADASPGGWSLRGPAAMPADFNDGWKKEVGATWSAPDSEWLWLATHARFADITSGIWRMRRSADGSFELATGVSKDVCSNLSCGQMIGIHGASADTIWAVGDYGSAIRVTGANGDTPAASAFNTQTWASLNGVWSASDSEAWAVGAAGVIVHYKGDGIYWVVASDVPTKEDLNGVWGTSPSDVWAVGNGGVVLHYDGTAWSRVKIAGLGSRRPDLFAVWSPGPGHIWVGGKGVIVSLGGQP